MHRIYLEIARLLDHSLLKPTLSMDELESGCQRAAELGVASVCVVPHYLTRCARILSGSEVVPTTVVSFPHGMTSTDAKCREAECALEQGAVELDVVVNLSRVLSQDWGYVDAELEKLLTLCRKAGAKLKVIFENCYLSQTHKLQLCEICNELSVDWVKTSTGFGSGGATPEDVKLMRSHSSAQVGVKASGGIRDLDAVLRYRALGVSRIGTSNSEVILRQLEERLRTKAIEV